MLSNSRNDLNQLVAALLFVTLLCSCSKNRQNENSAPNTQKEFTVTHSKKTTNGNSYSTKEKFIISSKKIAIPPYKSTCEGGITYSSNRNITSNDYFIKAKINTIFFNEYYVIKRTSSQERDEHLNRRYITKFRLSYPVLIGRFDTSVINKIIKNIYIQPLLEYRKEKYLLRRNITDSATFFHSRYRLTIPHIYGNEGIKSISFFISKNDTIISIIGKDEDFEYSEEYKSYATPPIYFSLRNNKITLFTKFINSDLLTSLKAGVNKKLGIENAKHVDDSDIDNWPWEFTQYGFSTKVSYPSPMYVFIPLDCL